MRKNNLLFITGFIGLSMVIAGCGEAPYVAVEEVSISGSNTVEVGETIQLSAAVTPDNATNKTITWSSDHPEFATVSETGMVTGVAKGTVTITASAADNKSNSLIINVTKNYAINYPSIEGMTFTGPAKAQAGEKVSFTITTNKVIESVKMNGTDCTREEDGYSFTMPEGVANITITTIIPVTAVTVTGESTVEVGQTITLSAAVTPDNATYKNITWSSEDATIASVSEAGVVTANAKGTTNIIATAHNGVNASFAVVVTEHFAINYPTAEDMIFEGPRSAQVGDLVKFTITTNAAIASVKMNGNECGTSNGEYYFYMPGAAATITVTKASAPVVTGYAINVAAGNVSFEGPERAEAGVDVVLTALINPGYSLTSVTVYGNINAFDPEDRTVIPSTFAAGILAFEMPAEDVKIEYTATANYYDLTFVCDNEEVLGQVGSTVTNAATGETIRAVENNKVRHVPYGTSVKVSVTTSSYFAKKAKATGLIVDGVTYPVVDGYITFTMPFHSVAAEITYDDILREYTVTNSDHISLALYSKVGNEYVAYSKTGLVFGETVYMKATIEEGSGVDIKAVSVVYKGSYSSDTTVSVSGPNDDGYYSFVVPEAENPIRISVSELNPNKFAGRSFLGTYVGFNLCSGKPYKEPTLYDNTSVAASGEMKFRGTAYELDSADDTTGVMTLTSGKKIGYTTNFIYAYYYLSDTTIFSTDNMVYYKMAEGATKANYKFYAVQTTDKLNNMVDVYKDGEHVDGLFIHFEENTSGAFTVYSGVKFVFDDNTKRISDEGALAFEVRDANDAYICEFVGNSTSTKASLTYQIKDGLQGTYTGTDGDLVLDGVGGASLNGVAGFEYTYENSVLTIVKTERTSRDTYVITLGEGTYIITDHSQEALTPSIFSGYTFTGTYNDSWDGNSALKVAFDVDSGTISGYIQCGTDYAVHKFFFTGSYDADTQVLTFSIYKALHGSSESVMEKDVTANVTDQTLTFTANIQSNMYDISGGVATCSDFHL